MGKRPVALCFAVLISVILIANTGLGRTWHVEKDGSGDFTVIQDAVDAALDGDTISIGPGRYTEYTEYWWGNVYVDLDGTRSLTLIGSGEDETIIGPDVYESFFNNFGIRSDNGSAVYRIENLRLENQNKCGLAMYNAEVDLINCVIERSYLGAHYIGDIQRVLIEGCRFFNGPNQSLSGAIRCQSAQTEIRNTEVKFYRSGIHLDSSYSTNVLVTDCTFIADSSTLNYGLAGLKFSSWAGGTVENCYFSGWHHQGFVVDNAGIVVFRNNVVENCIGAGVGLLHCTNFTMHDNIISNCVPCVYVGDFNYVQSIHNNHFIRNEDVAGRFIRTTGFYPYGPHHMDFSGNYWGTTDVDEISEWIFDGYDDEDVWLYVDFLPIADGPVPTQDITLDGLKALYK